MKKHVVISCLVFLICSVIYISFPSSVVAASPQDDQSDAVSFLKLKPTGPVAYGQPVAVERSGEHDVSHMVNIPVKSGLNAFFDLARSADQEITKKNNSMDFRTVFGFHIPLN